MATKPIEKDTNVFVTGNEVVAWAALAADAQIMYGYPITPQNEIMHYWTRLAPKHDRNFLQTEDELSAGFTTCGGVLTGTRAFTATAGPGTVLMQEPLSMAEMMRIPMVVAVQQRGGPSTATVIYSQQEVTMCCYGGNGEGFRVVYSTSSHQDLYDYTIKAFNTAWKYSVPTIILGDGYQAKMREAVTMYDPASRGIVMEETTPYIGAAGKPGVDREPAFFKNTYNTEEELLDVVNDLKDHYDSFKDEIVEYEEDFIDDADIIVVGHGVVSRACKEAVKDLRKNGYKVGYFRPITLRPFPGKQLAAAVEGKQNILVVESALGQMKRFITEELYGLTVPITDYFKPGKGVSSDELVDKVKSMMK
jgi:2-oxoglutarate ferredoxin oxidoreductase subunit alpha